MRFVIYKNSVLATICSMFGAACVVMAVSGLVGKEVEIIPAVGMIAFGIVLMWLASIISEKKAKRKQAKAAAKAAQAASSSANYAQPRQSVQTADYTAAKPIKASAVIAGILFLLASALGYWACESASIRGYWHNELNSEQVLLSAMSLVMFIAAFRTKHIQQVSFLYLIGFLGLTLGCLDVALCTYRDYGLGGYSTSQAVYNMLVLTPALKVAAYFLMTLFALFSMRKIKKHLGGIVRFLWLLPFLALALAYAKWFGDNYILEACEKVFIPQWIGIKYLPREALEAISQMMVLIATFLSGFCFQRLCKTPAFSQQQAAYAQPAAPQYTAPQYTAPQYTAPKPEPQPEPRYTAPEPPKPAAQPQAENYEDVKKKLQAYKDLLDCGILTLEEYEQKLRELKRG